MTTIILADDHDVVRKGVQTLLEAAGDLTIIGQAADGLETVELVEKLQPDVLVVDLMMPGITGLEVARQVRQRVPRTRVVVLSMHTTESYVLEALNNGAAAYVLKTASGEEVVHAVREVVRGKRYLSPPLSERAIDAYLQSAQTATQDSYDRLTSREREVLHLVAQGYTNNDIAGRLSISPRTSENHRANLMHKLGLHTQTDVIRYAIRRGIVPLE